MRIYPNTGSVHAFTRVEAIVVGVAILVLILLLIPFGRARARATRAQCINNLKQLGTAHSYWLLKNEDRPLCPAVQTATRSQNGDLVSAIFLQLTNHLPSSKILACPGLRLRRPPASSWQELTDRNIGYALGERSASFVFSDMHIEGMGREERVEWAGIAAPIRAFEFGASRSGMRWSRTNHSGMGQMSLIDGSVVAGDDVVLRTQLGILNGGTHTFRILVPQ